MSKQISLSRGKVAIVDDADFEWLNRWKWCYVGSGYAMRRETTEDGKSRYVYMHRQIMNAPEGHYVDHINHDTLNNCRENLRIANPSQNLYNRVKGENKASVFKGVRRSRTRWQATIQISRKSIPIGRFLTQREAAEAYNQAAQEHYSEFAYFNDLSILPPEQDIPLIKKHGLQSPYHGIYLDKRRNHWIAEIMVNRVKQYLGSFSTPEDAARAYDAFVKEHGLNRQLNFP